MRTVMLVEDEELILQGILNIIDWEEIGMKVVHMAHNGQEALKMWQEEPVDIVITDISMPVMDGLTFLERLREIDQRTRCILLTGYDEFEYARKAISLDVEDYILKPIDEEKLGEILIQTDERLKKHDRKMAVDVDHEVGWLRFFRGSLKPEEKKRYIELLPPIKKDSLVSVAVMKLDLSSMQQSKVTDVLVELKAEENRLRAIYLSADSLLLLIFGGPKSGEEIGMLLAELQNRIESRYGILSFISMGDPIESYEKLGEAYQQALRLQKYQIIEGYGSCITAGEIESRKFGDLSVDTAQLRKLILKKECDDAVDYLEDLFINNIRKETNVNDLFRMCLKIAMLLQEIKEEYKLQGRKNMRNLNELMDKVYRAEDLFAIRTMFIGEVTEIISCLHEENSQYTPVVKQILAEVQQNYREDMNLKTLSYKYHMNTSYLGQIFQREVGCSFAKYVSNMKNSMAKDLILNTNMKITDIAKEVGYPDTSYFYRKFKQCYGVSPASLREMKKY